MLIGIAEVQADAAAIPGHPPLERNTHPHEVLLPSLEIPPSMAKAK
jgi:hypothetical protein